LAAACLSAASFAADPLPDPGAGPHRDYDEQKGGPGAKPRSSDPQPKLPALPSSGASKDGGASSGSSADQDERKATESKEKAKKRPGYKDDAPSPRA
jgi:hypothetical protein